MEMIARPFAFKDLIHDHWYFNAGPLLNGVSELTPRCSLGAIPRAIANAIEDCEHLVF
jgi:hypothetical protein